MKRESRAASYKIGWREANKIRAGHMADMIFESLLEENPSWGVASCACGEALTKEEEQESVFATIAESYYEEAKKL